VAWETVPGEDRDPQPGITAGKLEGHRQSVQHELDADDHHQEPHDPGHDVEPGLAEGPEEEGGHQEDEPVRSTTAAMAA
jgi:hypothetical protein